MGIKGLLWGRRKKNDHSCDISSFADELVKRNQEMLENVKRMVQIHNDEMQDKLKTV